MIGKYRVDQDLALLRAAAQGHGRVFGAVITPRAPRGFGFVKSGSQLYFLHCKQLLGGPDFPERGTLVEFTVTAPVRNGYLPGAARVIVVADGEHGVNDK